MALNILMQLLRRDPKVLDKLAESSIDPKKILEGLDTAQTMPVDMRGPQTMPLNPLGVSQTFPVDMSGPQMLPQVQQPPQALGGTGEMAPLDSATLQRLQEMMRVPQVPIPPAVSPPAGRTLPPMRTHTLQPTPGRLTLAQILGER